MSGYNLSSINLDVRQAPAAIFIGGRGNDWLVTPLQRNPFKLGFFFFCQMGKHAAGI